MIFTCKNGHFYIDTITTFGSDASMKVIHKDVANKSFEFLKEKNV